MQISAQSVIAYRRKVPKTVTDRQVDGDPDGWTDGDLDGHHHTIILPV